MKVTPTISDEPSTAGGDHSSTFVVELIRGLKSMRQKSPSFEPILLVLADTATAIARKEPLTLLPEHSVLLRNTLACKLNEEAAAYANAYRAGMKNSSRDDFPWGKCKIKDVDEALTLCLTNYRETHALEPSTAKFWKVYFGGSTSAFFENCIKKSVQQAVLEGIDTSLVTEVLQYKSLVRAIREAIVGNNSRVTPQQLQTVVEKSVAFRYPHAVTEVILSFYSHIPKEDPALRELLESLDLPDVQAACLTVRDAGVTLRDIWKLNPVRTASRLKACGLAENSADIIAFEIHKQKQQELIANVTARMAPENAIEKALVHIRRGDEHISLRAQDVDSDTACELFSAFDKEGVSLTSLDLGCNDLRSYGVSHLVKALPRMPFLKTLDLTGNSLNDDGTEAICKALLTNKNITDLNLSVNNAKENGARDVANLLQKVPNLEKISFSFNSCGLAGAKQFAAAIAFNASSGNHLRWLSLQGNNLFGSGSAIVFEALKDNQVLTYLNVSANGVDDEACVALARTLNSNRSLIHVDISHNPVRAKGISALANAMVRNTVLLRLIIFDGKSALEGNEQLAEIENKLRDNLKFQQEAIQELYDKAIETWSISDVMLFVEIGMRRVGLAQIFQKNEVDGVRLVGYTRQAMEEDGILKGDREEVISAVLRYVDKKPCDCW